MLALPLLAVARPAAAQSAPTEAPSGTMPESTAQDDDAQFCHDRWLAPGRCTERRRNGPLLVAGGSLGVSAMNEGGPFGFGGGIGSVTSPGPAWGLLAGIEVLPWLAFEARYAGMYDGVRGSASPGGTLGYLTTAGDLTVRFTAPLPFVHPYVFGGVGYYDSALLGSSSARAASPMNGTSEPAIPMGVGVDVPLSWHLSVGAEATYHFLVGESFSSQDTGGMDGGDISTFTAVVRLRP